GKNSAYTIIPENREPGDEHYSPYILSLAATPIPAEVLARTLDDKGICVGTGSACSNRKKGQSKTLAAMGVADNVSFSRIRVSIGSITTEEDIEELIRTLDQESSILRKALR
ncbi:MAG: aminotransferase class V-fold PLP-dependent enzyme, partial [Spirochaetia bacterium]|nr:aminotransferase class V-fold PLP-dependent enzyme [Spirochaetia bacterium]